MIVTERAITEVDPRDEQTRRSDGTQSTKRGFASERAAVVRWFHPIGGMLGGLRRHSVRTLEAIRRRELGECSD